MNKLKLLMIPLIGISTSISYAVTNSQENKYVKYFDKMKNEISQQIDANDSNGAIIETVKNYYQSEKFSQYSPAELSLKVEAMKNLFLKEEKTNKKTEYKKDISNSINSKKYLKDRLELHTKALKNKFIESKHKKDNASLGKKEIDYVKYFDEMKNEISKQINANDSNDTIIQTIKDYFESEKFNQYSPTELSLKIKAMKNQFLKDKKTNKKDVSNSINSKKYLKDKLEREISQASNKKSADETLEIKKKQARRDDVKNVKQTQQVKKTKAIAVKEPVRTKAYEPERIIRIIENRQTQRKAQQNPFKNFFQNAAFKK